jgi:hypothetical protein
MSPDDSLHDLLQIDVPGISSPEEEEDRSRDVDLLNSLRIASPCDASWGDMAGDDLVRFCQHCRKNVYNLSGMSRRHAADFVRQAEDRHCIRFYRRRDGTVLTDDCPIGWRAARRWLLARMASAFGFLGIGLGVRAVMRSVLERSLASEADGPSGRGSYLIGGPPGGPITPPSRPAVHLGKVNLGIIVAPYREATPRRQHHRRRPRHGRRR